MKTKLKEHMKTAMKAKDKIRLSTIRSLLSALQYEEMKKEKEELADDETLKVVRTEIKKRKESLEFAEQAGRQDQVDNLNKELSVLEGFLPKQLEEKEIETILTDFMDATPSPNMGALMQYLKSSFSGQYDGKTASSICKKLLG